MPSVPSRPLTPSPPYRRGGGVEATFDSEMYRQKLISLLSFILYLSSSANKGNKSFILHPLSFILSERSFILKSAAKVLKKNEKNKFYLHIPKKSSNFARFFG